MSKKPEQPVHQKGASPRGRFFKAGVITGAVGALTGPHLMRWAGRRALQRLQRTRSFHLLQRVAARGEKGAAAVVAAAPPAIPAATPVVTPAASATPAAARGRAGQALALAKRVTSVAKIARPVLPLAAAGLAVGAVAAVAVIHLKGRQAAKKDLPKAPPAPPAVPKPQEAAPKVPEAASKPPEGPPPATSAAAGEVEDQVGAALNSLFQKLGLNLRAAKVG